MPDWLQDFAALTTVGLAAVWLLLRWFHIGRPRPAPGCARCEHNASAPASGQARGVRSKRLRVLG